MTTTQTKKLSRRYGVRRTEKGTWGILDTATGWFSYVRDTRAAAEKLAKLLNKKGGRTVKIKCTNTQTGETWYAYDGAVLTQQRAECEAKAIERQWPHIKATLEAAE